MKSNEQEFTDFTPHAIDDFHFFKDSYSLSFLTDVHQINNPEFTNFYIALFDTLAIDKILYNVRDEQYTVYFKNELTDDVFYLNFFENGNCEIGVYYSENFAMLQFPKYVSFLKKYDYKALVKNSFAPIQQ